MRKNLPVSQRLHALGDDDILMSVTDKDSHIHYCNARFVEVSGFEREELLGQPHNIVRHPDMPPDAFADMWNTLKSGLSWTGAVKNRRKNGDHYWVQANATPVIRNGELKGYQSVRIALSQHEIDKAEALYRRMRQGKLRWHRLYRGIVVFKGPLAWLSLGKRMGLRTRLGLLRSLQAAIVLTVCALLGIDPHMLVSIAMATLGSMILTGLLLEKQLVRPLKRILNQAVDVSTGQMRHTVSLGRVDELGMLMRAVNQSGLNVRSLINDVSQQIDGLNTSSEVLSQGTRTLGDRTRRTAENLQRTAAAMVETAQSLEQNASNARELASRSSNTSSLAEESRSAFDNLMKKMEVIESSSERISDIIGLIDGVAFQTNILALNAAVEAARAGEDGRSFAVVANEVRVLAERSTSAAADIKDLITDSAQGIREGTELAMRAGEATDSIREQFVTVADLIENISQSIIEQSAAVSEVSSALESVDGMTSSNNDLVQESSESSQSLMRQALQMSDAVAAYRGQVGNGRRHRKAA